MTESVALHNILREIHKVMWYIWKIKSWVEKSGSWVTLSIKTQNRQVGVERWVVL